MGGLTIHLPEDPERITRLQKKLEEYRARMKSHVKERDLVRDYDTECKITILDNLLKNKVVALKDLEEEFAANDPQAAPYLYNAFAVIQDYVLTGGANLSPDRGTGLPGLEKK